LCVSTDKYCVTLTVAHIVIYQLEQKRWQKWF
jgi:hypothetical protein